MRRKKKTKLKTHRRSLASNLSKYSENLTFSTEDSVEKLKLPSNIESALLTGNIETIGKLIKTNRKRLYKVNSLGKKSVNYLIRIKGFISRRLINEVQVSPELVSTLYPQTIPSVDFSIPEINIPLKFSRNHSINVLNLPIRLEGALHHASIHRLGELYDYPERKLLKQRNIGPKAVEYLNYLKSKIIFGSYNSSVLSDEDTNTIPNDQLVNILISKCADDKSKEIIQRRYGLLIGEKETLEEIGESHGVTRERIRQIQLKARKRMNHISNVSKRPIIYLVEKLLKENSWVISDEEADKLLPTIFQNLTFDGSSLLDLLKDLGWIQSHEVGDVIFYSPNLDKITLGSVMDGIIKFFKKNRLPASIEEIVENVPEIKDISVKDFDILSFIRKCCKVDPRINEKTNDKYGLYIESSRAQNLWIPLMMQVLETECTPLHFTEIADRVNDLVVTPGVRLDHRRAHGLLVEKNIFAHVGIRGTYGLTKWGLRKDPTIEIVSEFIENAGFPVHFEQIYDYVKRYKDSPKVNIKSILEVSGKFINKGQGLYDLKR